MTALVLFGSASYYGPYNDYDVDYGPSYDQFYTSIFSGATQNWNLILPPNPGSSGQVLTTNGTGVTYWSTVASSGGSVTTFSSGNLSPLFTTSVATPTTTPALSFALNTQLANTVFAGPVSGGAATPTFRGLNSADIPVPGSTGDVLYNNGGVLGAALTTITAAGSITLPDTQTIQWTGSAYSSVGLSQLAADTLAVGNGTESDVSGAMAMTALILYGSSYYSAYDAFHTTIYSGATQNWNLVLPETAGVNGQVLVNIGSGFTEWESVSTLGVPWSALTNASANLTLANGTFTTTFNQTSNAAWLWANTSTGTSGSTNASPLHELAANYYTGSASAQDLWTIGSVLAAGTNGTSKLTFTHSGTTGTASVDFPGNLTFANAATVTFNSTNNGTTYEFQSQGNNTFLLKASTSVGAAIIEGNGNGAGGYLALIGNITSQTTGNPGVALGNQSSMTAASGSMVGVNIGGNTSAALTFAPTSGSASITGLLIAPTIGGTTTGNTTALYVNPTTTTTSLTGTNMLAVFANGGVQKAAIDYSGNYYSGTTVGLTETATALTSITTLGGLVTATSDVSDERLKDWKPFTTGLAAILKVNPIKFTYNSDGQTKTGISGERTFAGFSAQNVQAAGITEAVFPSNTNEGFLGFEPRAMIATLVNAVKTLEARIRELEK
jgi:hypothetical protein